MVDAHDAREWSMGDAAAYLRAPVADDDKYSRGVVGVRTGSDTYPGAAVLGVEAACRAGAGMVRYLGPRRASEFVLHRRPEVVTAHGRVQAWVTGSGMDVAARPAPVTAVLRHIAAGALPVVIDAGALDLAPDASAPVVVTPHASEHAALRRRIGLDDATPKSDDARAAQAAETAAAIGVAVLLKGAVTIVATPSGWTTRVSSGTAWLATAGTGDVLAGALGALVAAAQARREADGGTLDAEALGPLAATAAWVHGRAGAIAAERNGGGRGTGPITALDVADALPAAIAAVLATPE
ncbi:ADP-dependent NAD(P)H-hydrate dehydratase [Microbacterium luticocti]|uniref:ADP-dependent NAD(P)H-hydrate dehydratase n=1 Tax=Microbacterium luticocti TaxID=451764 RepID=UPI00041093C7|nr:ADP/ATP-dependent (S)-NAD(P)H-hydrate dehydratase [Microbacterium luticocti]